MQISKTSLAAATAFVQLNSNGPDTGETGWSWKLAHEGDPERWGWLGDHNNATVA